MDKDIINLIPVDSHNHTTLSPDAENTPEEMVARAMQLGISHYTVTDHLEINKFYDEEYLYEAPVMAASEIMPKLKEEYKDKIDVLYGVELGQPLFDLPLTTRILATYNYDFIIGSVHYIRGYDDFYYLDYRNCDIEKLLEQYYAETLEMAQWGGFDVLGHMTYPLRYITGNYGIEADMSRYSKIIDEIFKVLIKNNMGIEINTSGLFQKIKQASPDLPLVKRYRELGGEIITIGSDAHCVKDLGRGIPEGIEIARKAGFDKICYFEKRNPKFIDI